MGTSRASSQAGRSSRCYLAFCALVLSALLIRLGPKVLRAALAALGLLGTALIGVAVATTSGYDDAAVPYMWPAV